MPDFICFIYPVFPGIFCQSNATLVEFCIDTRASSRGYQWGNSDLCQQTYIKMYVLFHPVVLNNPMLNSQILELTMQFVILPPEPLEFFRPNGLDLKIIAGWLDPKKRLWMQFLNAETSCFWKPVLWSSLNVGFRGCPRCPMLFWTKI